MVTPLVMTALLVIPYLASKARRAAPRSQQRAAVGGIALVFLFTGVGHFIETGPMTEMLPEVVPQRVLLVYISGILEIGLAVLILMPPLQRPVGGLLLVMLIAFLPLNIYAALNRVPMGGHVWGPTYLLIRVPLQLLLMIWIARFAVAKSARQVEAWGGPGQPG